VSNPNGIFAGTIYHAALGPFAVREVVPREIVGEIESRPVWLCKSLSSEDDYLICQESLHSYEADAASQALYGGSDHPPQRVLDRGDLSGLLSLVEMERQP